MNAKEVRALYYSQTVAALRELGMDPSLNGFSYCRFLIGLLTERGTMTGLGALYAEAAAVFSTSPSRVERDVRYAVERTWQRGRLDAIDRRFGYSVDRERGKPTNREFVCRMAESVMESMNRA